MDEEFKSWYCTLIPCYLTSNRMKRSKSSICICCGNKLTKWLTNSVLLVPLSNEVNYVQLPYDVYDYSAAFARALNEWKPELRIADDLVFTHDGRACLCERNYIVKKKMLSQHFGIIIQLIKKQRICIEKKCWVSTLPGIRTHRVKIHRPADADLTDWAMTTICYCDITKRVTMY